MAGNKSRDMHPCFHNGPLWVCRIIIKSYYFGLRRFQEVSGGLRRSHEVSGDLVGKWFAVIYDGGRRNQLFIAKVMKRFLINEGGPVDNILL